MKFMTGNVAKHTLTDYQLQTSDLAMGDITVTEHENKTDFLTACTLDGDVSHGEVSCVAQELSISSSSRFTCSKVDKSVDGWCLICQQVQKNAKEVRQSDVQPLSHVWLCTWLLLYVKITEFY